MPPLNTITIREKAKDSELFNIAVSFNSGPEYPGSIKNPFDSQTEQLFEWYFEVYKHLFAYPSLAEAVSVI